MRATLVTLLALTLVAGALYADGDYEVKWSQPVNLDGFMYFSNLDLDNGLAWNTAWNPYVAYSDFICEDGEPVLGVHWWGGYWNMTGGPGLNNIDGFYINFYLDAGGVPGAQVYGSYHPLGACNETSTGTYGADEAETFQYLAWLDPYFYQELGVHYWIGIFAEPIDPANPNGWGWRDATGQWLFPDLSQDIFTGAFYAQDPDRAYELVIPEPGVISLAGLLLGAGALWLRRE